MGKVTKRPGGWEVRLRYGAGQRDRFLIKVESELIAEDRAVRLQAMAARLANAGRHADAKALLTEAAGLHSGAEFRKLERAVSELTPLDVVPSSGPRTYGEVLRLWIEGELHHRYPDDVKALKPNTLGPRLYMAAAIDRVLGHLAITSVTEEHAEAAKVELTRGLGQGSRRQYALMIRRVMTLAEHPLRLIERNPIRSKFVPPQGQGSVFGWLYPSEDEQLMRCSSIPVDDRLIYGVLIREGMRLSEALKLLWGDLDLERGTLTLDENKTNQPRAWVLGDDVAAALRAYRGNATDDDVVFPMFNDSAGAASRFRAHLWEALVRRKQLHTKTGARRPIRIHDLRASFITMAFAVGRTEAWITTRTGHTSSRVLHGYHRMALTASELPAQDQGWFGPLHSLLGLRDPLAHRVGQGVGASARSAKKTAIPSSTASTPDNTEVAENPDVSGAGKPEPAPTGPAEIQGVGQSGSPAEQALAFALEEATKAKRWDVVLELSRQLEARRLERAAPVPGVASLADARKKRDEGSGK